MTKEETVEKLAEFYTRVASRKQLQQLYYDDKYNYFMSMTKKELEEETLEVLPKALK